MAVSNVAIGEAVNVFGQIQGEHIQTTVAHPVRSIQDTETPEQKTDRMRWFREARFGMLVLLHRSVGSRA